MLPISKAHAYGNDFLFMPRELAGDRGSALAKQLCQRHTGIGADGLILYERRVNGATMQLFNADGSFSELSGNGLRCLGAIVARHEQLEATAGTRPITIDTDAGAKTLELLVKEGERYTFRTSLGAPTEVRQLRIPVLGETVTATVLRVGNPQCVVLGPLPDESRFMTLGRALATHDLFPEGTNVEFAEVEAPDRVRILIWERGVGPTSSSGTGTSAAAVAAAAHGGARRELQVVAPGGTQSVDWRPDGIYLTGWAEVVFEGRWVGGS